MRRSGTLILCYHRVAEGVEDPFRLCVRPGNFAAHLEEMSLLLAQETPGITPMASGQRKSPDEKVARDSTHTECTDRPG